MKREPVLDDDAQRAFAAGFSEARRCRERLPFRETQIEP